MPAWNPVIERANCGISESKRDRNVAAGVESALRWIIEERTHFDWRGEDQYLDAHGAKALFELAIMVYCHARVKRSYTTLRPLLETLQSQREGRDFDDRPIRSRTDVIFHAFLYAVLRDAGLDDNIRQRELIQRAVHARILEHVERLPHRIMEERLALEWGGFSHALPSWEQLLDDSILKKAPSPLHLDTEGVYQITHVILFLFGFGLRREPVEFGDLGQLRRLLSALIITFCGEQHWDLVGELLLCWDCLELKRGEIYKRGWDAFLTQQADDGSFPGPQSRSERLPSDADGSKTPDKRRQFLERYHTTLVAILAGDGYLRRRAHNTPRLESVSGSSCIPGMAGDRVIPGVEKDAEWLGRLLDRASTDDDPRPKVDCSILLGTWVCAALNGELLSRVPEVAGRVAERLRIVTKWADVPPALSILANALLLDCGIAVPELARFVRELVKVLSANSADDALSDLAFCEKRVLLHHLGLVKQPILLELADFVRAARAMPLHGSRTAVERLLLCVGSSTGYGTRIVRMAGDQVWVGELLSGLAVRFFRSSDVLTACTVLRNMAYIGVTANLSPTDLIDFILLQRRPEGGYGFFGAAEASISAASGGGFFAGRDIYLPVTLSCLWTLAELTTGWRLYSSVGRDL